MTVSRRGLASSRQQPQYITLASDSCSHRTSHFFSWTHLLTFPSGCLNFTDENDEVLISGFGRRGKAKGDIPGVRFKVVKVSGVGLLALWKEKK
jgi:hypothetical protein